MGALDKRLYTSHPAPTDAVVEMESLQFVGCSWFIGLIGLVSDSPRINLTVAIPPRPLTDPESRAFSDSLLFESTDTVTGPELTQHLPFTSAPERSQNMGALDKRLYISHHTPTDTVARVGPACMKLALNGCSYLQSPVRLSFQRHRTYNPHPCTVLLIWPNKRNFSE